MPQDQDLEARERASRVAGLQGDEIIISCLE